MARSASIVSDSDGKPDDAQAPEDDTTKSVALNGENEEDEEEEEEFEIEEVLKHNKGQFPEGRVGYYVKWKNYGPEHNSWVDEQDAGNAQELISAYWTKKNAAKAKLSAARGRKSTVTHSPEPSKKRRKSVKNDDDEEQQESVSTKKKRTSKKRMSSIEHEIEPKEEVEEDEVAIGESFMEKYKNRHTWDDLISRIDTVEKPSGSAKSDDLVVYFKLKKDDKRVRLPASTCNEKFPQLMLKFYESNLKWKETEMDVDEDMAS